jgi:hypothetical protein
MLESVSLLTNKKRYLKERESYGDKILRGNGKVLTISISYEIYGFLLKEFKCKCKRDLVEDFKSM